MNLSLELRYAILISLLMLLWLALEFMVGLQDKYANLHVYVSMFAVVIPIVISRQAIIAKREDLRGKITFKQAFITGMLVAAISAVLAVPVQLAFHTLINPDFFDTMQKYSVQHAMHTRQNVEQAKLYAASQFNLTSYIIQSVVFTLIIGTVISLVMAFTLRTEK